MIKSIVGAVIILAAASLGFSPNATAQGMDPCLIVTTWWFDAPVPPGWFNYSSYAGSFVYLIAANKFAPGCAPKPENPCQNCEASKPIQLANGNTYIDQTDVVLPGLGGGLTLRRRWNSAWPSTEIGSSIGMFGPNWRSTYEERAFLSINHWVVYSRWDGSYLYFGLDSISGGWLSLMSGGGGGGSGGGGGIVGWTPQPTGSSISFPNGEQRQFNTTTGCLTAIIDRYGNKTQITYDGSNRLTTVTDAASRHLYFNYPTGSNLVSSVTSDFGVSLSYTYDTQGRLSQVTKPDLTTITFTYDAQSNITAVTDQNGKIIESHTYNANGQGLTASQANGVNAVTVTYP